MTKSKRQAPMKAVETKECCYCGGEIKQSEKYCRLCGTKRRDLVIQNLVDACIGLAVVVFAFIIVVLMSNS
jgi:hypothetical protein